MFRWESQKGVNAVQWCSVENQKGVSAVQWCSRWDPEGRYHNRLCTVIAPFWFSTEHLYPALTPFWLSTDNMIELLWGYWHTLSVKWKCSLYERHPLKYTASKLIIFGDSSPLISNTWIKKIKKKNVEKCGEITECVFKKNVLAMTHCIPHTKSSLCMNTAIAIHSISVIGYKWNHCTALCDSHIDLYEWCYL